MDFKEMLCVLVLVDWPVLLFFFNYRKTKELI